MKIRLLHLIVELPASLESTKQWHGNPDDDISGPAYNGDSQHFGFYEIAFTHDCMVVLCTMKMERGHTALYLMKDHQENNYVPGTPEERICLVWPLTREAASLSKKHDVEQRLQRDVTGIIRRKGKVHTYRSLRHGRPRISAGHHGH